MTNLNMSSMTFGCEPLGGTDWGDVDLVQIEAAIKLALDKGVNSFDTADVYGLGKSEERLSQILGAKRHDVTIATKVGIRWFEPGATQRAKVVKDGSAKYLKQAVHASLKRLRLDSLPICYLHWPDPQVPVSYSIEALDDLKREGKIQAIGCSNISLQQLKEARSVAEVEIVQLQYNLIDRAVEADLLPYCQQNKIAVAVYGVLAQGLLTGKYNDASVFPENDRRTRLSGFKDIRILHIIQELASYTGMNKLDCASMAIQWVLGHNAVATIIVGIKNPLQLNQNVEAIQGSLTQLDRDKLEELFCSLKGESSGLQSDISR